MKKKEAYAILLLSFLSGTLMGCGKADPLKTTAGHAIETCMDAEKETQEISGAETFSEPEARQTEEASETTKATSLAETEEMQMILEAYQKYVDEQLPVKDGYAYELIYVDEDNIPELFAESDAEAGGNLLLTYHEGMVYADYTDRLGGFQYIEKANFYKNSNGHMGYYYDIFYTIIDGQQTTLAEGYWGDKWENGEVVWDYEADYPMQEYFWNGEECSSKEEYEEAIATFCEAAVKSDNWKSAGSFSDEMYLDVYTAYEALQK